MTNYKQYVLTAKTATFVPANKKIQGIKKKLSTLQSHMQRINKTIGKINSSKSANPKIKMLRVKQQKALQTYLKSSIILNQERIKQLQHPS